MRKKERVREKERERTCNRVRENICNRARKNEFVRVGDRKKECSL